MKILNRRSLLLRRILDYFSQMLTKYFSYDTPIDIPLPEEMLVKAHAYFC